MKFLSGKNVALMKKDVEGYEGKVIKGGIEIISKNIKFNNIYFRYLRDKIYLSEDFKCPFTSFRIEKQLLTFNRTYF